VTNGVDLAEYSYLAGRSLVGQINFSHAGVARMTTTEVFDLRGRLTTNATSVGGSAVSACRYGYDPLVDQIEGSN